MSKKIKEETEQVVEEHHNNGAMGSDDKAKDAIENLKVQLEEHLKQADHHRTMATKAQGALEVLLQLHPQDNSGEGS